MSDLIGQLLSDRYQILGPLGAGGMGSVYKALDRNLGREVAIKIMHSRLSDKSDFSQRFHQEARTAARFSHPGIVQVFDFVTTESLHYIVMELIQGENLDQMMRRLRKKQQWITLQESVELVRQIALALDYAHRQGVVHRDIKPANIMLKAEHSDPLPYRPVLADLGLAKLAEGGVETQVGITMGTPAYMSPEQTQGEEMDARSDIYSLGILLYELAVGQVPFPAKTLTQALRYHVYEQPPTPRTLSADLPESLEAIILRALQKKADNRYRTAGEMAEALSKITLGPAAQTIPPVALRGASSLLTQYRDSLIELHGVSIVPTSPAGPGKSPEILVRTPSGAERRIALTTIRITVGRQPDNTIAIEDAKASRYHASIEFDGVDVWVTDQKSTNGVFIGKEQLQPNARTRWESGLPLRIGDHHLFLQGLSTADATKVSAIADHTMVAPPLQRSGEPRPVSQTLTLTLTATEIKVEPGQRVKVPLVLQNLGTSALQVSLRLTGVPNDWVVPPPTGISVAAGTRIPVAITISPPRSPQCIPKRYSLTIQAQSPQLPAHPAIAQGALIVTPYTQFQSTLLQQPDDQQPPVVQIENQSNVTQTFRIHWRNEAGALQFDPAQLELKATPGETVTATAKIQPPRRPLFGRQQKYMFQTQVNAPGAQGETHTGIYTSRSLLPIWIAPLLAILFCGLVGGAWWYLRALPTMNEGSQLLNQVAAATVAQTQPGSAVVSVQQEKFATLEADESPTVSENGNENSTVAALAAPTLSPTATDTPPPPTATNTPTVPPSETSTPTVDSAATAQTVAKATDTANLWATATANAANQLTALAQATQQAVSAATQQAATAALAATTSAQQTSEAIRVAQAAAATQSAQLTAQAPPPTPTPPPAPARPGLVADFENLGVWTRGNEPWGELTQSNEHPVGGNADAKLVYDFTASQPDNDYVVFVRKPALPLPGKTKGLRMQVYGDGSGNLLNAWVQDSAGIVWQFTFGKLSHTGWAEMSAPFDLSYGWPNSIISGGNATDLTYPLRLYALVLNGEPRQTLKGTIYFDELFTTDTPAPANLAGNPPAATAATTAIPGDANASTIRCGADPPTIQPGKSTVLYWTITAVKAVYFEGKGVGGIDKRTVSPTQTTSYTVQIIRLDGTTADCVITVQVQQ